ncbi:MAG: hypothetical protein J6U54_03495 [Clostridiales bacterium]|nr:hypothetical protein [Clostridiales bacterium]
MSRTKRVVLVITTTKWGTTRIEDYTFFLSDDQWSNRKNDWKLRGLSYHWVNEDLIVIERKEGEGSK